MMGWKWCLVWMVWDYGFGFYDFSRGNHKFGTFMFLLAGYFTCRFLDEAEKAWEAKWERRR